MKDYKAMWENVGNIMKNTMSELRFDIWLADLQFEKVDEDEQVVRIGCRDPFRAAYIVRQFGDDLDKAVQLVYGEGFRVSIAFDKDLEVKDDRLKAKMTSYNAEHKVRAMLVVNCDVDDEELIDLKLGEFAEVRR